MTPESARVTPESARVCVAQVVANFLNQNTLVMRVLLVEPKKSSRKKKRFQNSKFRPPLTKRNYPLCSLRTAVPCRFCASGLPKTCWTAGKAHFGQLITSWTQPLRMPKTTRRPGNRPSRHCDFIFCGFNQNTWRCGFVHFFIMHTMVFSGIYSGELKIHCFFQ